MLACRASQAMTNGGMSDPALTNTDPAPQGDNAARFVQLSKAVADPLRRDILQVLQQDAFGVLELCRILDMAQPALSHHLKLLADAGLLARRRDGNAVFYRRALLDPADPLADYMAVLFETLDRLSLPMALAAGKAAVYQARAERSRKFFAGHAAAFQRQQALVSPPDAYLPALADMLAVLPGTKHQILDLGTGNGDALGLLATHFDAVLGLDTSAAMLETARQRLAASDVAPRVRLAQGELRDQRPQSFDAVLLSMVLHHAANPRQMLGEAARALKPSGWLLIVELCPHDQAWTRTACGDVWLGFEPAQLDHWVGAAGLMPGPEQYLAQRNGFRVQIKTYQRTTANNEGALA